MKRFVKSSAVSGVIQAPASKSVAQRAIALASMSDGRSEILNAGNSDDCHAAIRVCRELGATIDGDANQLIVDGGLKLPARPLNCGESGLSIRMFSPIASTLNGDITLIGEGSLMNRPMQIITDALNQFGVECSTANGFLPIQVKGPMKGGQISVDGSLSSQVLTGLLMASPMASSDVTILVDNLKSIPYVQLTIDMMRKFGVDVENFNNSEFRIKAPQRYKPCKYNVEGDWSGAAFLLVAGAIAGEVEVTNLNPRTLQADRAIINALMWSGAYVSIRENSIFVKKESLAGFDFDATHCPDLFPPLVALASHCVGESKILGVGRLKVKESDRAATLMEEFTKLGIDIKVQDDLMIIQGGNPQSTKVQSHGDHRIAMACAVATLNGNCEVEIDGAEAVSKSYPDFFEDLEQLVNLKMS
ncbi:MAG: 3-phosphoshikimate 1-carboxyvinyltransferase [Bacteroidales bacterium]|nr:MAG: 3-phosphoshikimate 1-carboxyvinyltransferase [Bacteroidales bacterium]